MPRKTAAELRRYLTSSASLTETLIRCDKVNMYLQLTDLKQKNSSSPCSSVLEQLEGLIPVSPMPIQADPAKKLEPDHVNEGKRPSVFELHKTLGRMVDLGRVPVTEPLR
jgi:hypothetical protein